MSRRRYCRASSSDWDWIVADVTCLACFNHWKAVYPDDRESPFLECPRCGKMAGQPDYGDEEDNDAIER